MAQQRRATLSTGGTTFTNANNFRSVALAAATSGRAFSTLLQLTSNILSHPYEERYRRLNARSASFEVLSNALSTDGLSWSDVLKELRFVPVLEVGTAEVTHWELPPRHELTFLRGLADALRVVELERQQRRNQREELAMQCAVERRLEEAKQEMDQVQSALYSSTTFRPSLLRRCDKSVGSSVESSERLESTAPSEAEPNEGELAWIESWIRWIREEGAAQLQTGWPAWEALREELRRVIRASCGTVADVKSNAGNVGGGSSTRLAELEKSLRLPSEPRVSSSCRFVALLKRQELRRQALLDGIQALDIEWFNATHSRKSERYNEMAIARSQLQQRERKRNLEEAAASAKARPPKKTLDAAATLVNDIGGMMAFVAECEGTQGLKRWDRVEAKRLWEGVVGGQIELEELHEIKRSLEERIESLRQCGKTLAPANSSLSDE